MAKKEQTTDLTEIPEDIMSSEQFSERAKSGRGNVFIGTLNVALQPAKAITSHVKERYRQRYKGQYKRAKLLFYIDMGIIGAIVIAAIIIGFLFLFKPSVAEKITVESTIMPEEVVSGKDVSFIWIYRNDSEVILEDIYWNFTLPTNFKLASTVPARTDPLKNVINLGTLQPGAEGRIKIYGRVWGTVGDSHTIWSNMSFVQAENKKREQKAITTSYVIADSVLKGSLEMPDKIINNQEINLKVYYHNTSNEILDNVEVHAYWPAGFEYLSSDLPLENNVWRLGGLEPDESGEISIKGYIASPEDVANFYFETYSRIDEENIRQEILAGQAQIVPPQLEIRTSINDATEPALSWGDEMKIALSYSNVGDYRLDNLIFAIEVDPYYVNTAKFTGLDFRDGKFYFTDEVGSINPGESRELVGTLYLKANPDFSSFEVPKDILVNLGIEAEYQVEGEDQSALYKTGRQSIKMNSPFWAQFFARYWAETGDQLGRGPIPPRVGQATKYWVFWSLGKTTNDLSNIYFQAKLPSNVRYSGLSSVTVGDRISYNPETNMITWSLKELSSTMAGSAQTVALSFEVEIIPSSGQAGAPAPIIEWMKMTATDQFTQSGVSYTTGSITTNLTSDERASIFGGNVR